MAGLNANARYIAEKLSDAVGVDMHVAEAAVHESIATIQAFMGAEGPLKLIFFYQIPEMATENGEFITTGSKPKLFLTTGEKERCRGKAYYFVRTGNGSKPIDPKNLDQEIAYGEISSRVLDSFYGVLKGVFTPSVTIQDWGKANVGRNPILPLSFFYGINFRFRSLRSRQNFKVRLRSSI